MDEKARADAALERALRRVCRVHGLVPENPSVVDFFRAYHGICVGIMEAAFESVEEALRGEAEGSAQVLQ